MKQPVISIITICYNSAKTLEETINSVLSQDYPALDYVIIDGGSTDGTLDIIEKYRSQLGYFHSEKDEGISDAFNKGIAAVKGDLIGIINSDDLLLPGALKEVAKPMTDKRTYTGVMSLLPTVIPASADVKRLP